MLKVLMARLQQRHRTFPYPEKMPELPDRFRGVPHIDKSLDAPAWKRAVAECPTGAMRDDRKIDLGKCLFCVDCACGAPADAPTPDFRMATRTREALVVSNRDTLQLAHALEEKARRLFGRSLNLRQVSAGGCNACEADTNVLNTPVFDLARFGINFVASPRHADGVLVTGPVSKHMELALRKTWEAVPDPKIAIAVGACAISGGPYIDHNDVCNGADSIIPIDLYVPGCPPHPWTILDGLLRFLGKLDNTNHGR